MAGYPDRATSLVSLRAAAAAGADVIELGVPYGDPLADGPVITGAAKVAREQEGGFGLAESIALAAEFIAGRSEAPPVVLMTYLNPLMRFGLPRAAEAMREAGVAGVIVPDMPPEAARPWLAVSEGLDTVLLVAPTSTDERLAVVAGASAGFVYCVSSTGVTGERTSISADLGPLVERVRVHTRLPIAVGFGVSTPMQVAEVGRIADGVIVGSAIVRRQPDPKEVEVFVREMRGALGLR
jgi:tryptophan synthase alpha chain